MRVGAVIRNPDQLDFAQRPAIGRRMAWRGRMLMLSIGREHDVSGRIDLRCRRPWLTLPAGVIRLNG